MVTNVDFGSLELTLAYTYVQAIYGTNGDDTLNGDQSGSPYGDNDFIYGFGGNDTLNGGKGSDWLSGGTGNDTLNGGGGYGYYGGMDIADYSYAAYGINANLATGGARAINLAYGDIDTFIGIEGLNGSNYNDLLYGDGGPNRLYGNAGDDGLFGGGNGDYLDGGIGNDWLFGEEGSDVLIGGLGNDYINGGNDTGIDRISYAYSSEGMVVNLKTGDAHASADPTRDVDLLVDIEGAVGTAYNDVITGSDGANFLQGAGGSDVIYGGLGGDTIYGEADSDVLFGNDGNDLITGDAGGDVIYGDAGDDDLYGGEGNDIIFGGAGNDEIDGGDGDDTILPTYPGTGVDVVHGGAGNDTLQLVSLTGSILVDLGAGFVSAPEMTVTFDGIENAIASNFNDHMTGDALANRLYGAGGADMIHGLDGNDMLDGGDGNDHLVGGNGDDLIVGGKGGDEVNGGAGFDIASYAGSNAAVNVDLKTGAASGGDAAGDFFVGIEGIIGSNFDDILKSADVSGELRGAAGNDTIMGRGGNDFLYGDQGLDSLNGGSGIDLLVGGAGRDTMTGGTGADTFRFEFPADSGVGSANRDRITDFAKGVDKVDLSLIDASSIIFGNQAFDFIGNTAFTPSDLLDPAASDRQLRYFFSGATTIIEGDVNGDALADFQIRLDGNINLGAADFVL